MDINSRKIICAYCSTLNPPGQNQCIACGAPLPLPPIVPLTITESEPAAPFSAAPPLETPALSQRLKEGAAVIGSGLGVLGIGSILLRAAAAAFAVAGAALIIGIAAGSESISFQSGPLFGFIAAAGGGLTGLFVGLVRKRIFWTLFSAPVGALLGSLLSNMLSPNASPGNIWNPLLSTSGALVFALIGGKNAPHSSLRCLQRLRPFVGLLWGVLFGLLGFFISHRIY